MMKEGYALGKPSTGVMVQQSLFSKKVQHIVDNLQSRRSGFYFDAKTSPLYQRRTAEQAKAVNPEKADDAIRSTKTGQRILDKNIQLKDGQYVGVRLDLNILKSTGVPVQAIHEGKEKTHVGGAGFYNGEVLKYAPSVTLRNVFFKINQPKRERIATGAQTKEPMGSADGQYVDTAPNFDGVEFRFNPKREHLFRDAAGRVLKYADEITTTGNSVFARGNLEYYGEEDVPGRAGNAPTEGVLMQPEGQQAQPTIDTDNRKVSYGQQETLFSQQGLPREETFAMQTMADLAGNTKEKLRASLQNRAPMDRSAFEGMPSSTIEEAESIFHAPNKTIVDRIEENKDHFWKMLAQKTVDQFRAIRDVSERGYMQARLSTATDGMLQGLLFNGHAGLDDGALTVLTEGKNGQKLKGLIETLAPLGREVDRFQQWMALNREALLPDHKRTPLLAKLVSKKDEYLKGDINGRPRAQVYEEVRKDMMALNKSVLDIALEQNLIDKEAYDRFSNDAFYIPFYKVMEDGKIESIRTASRMTNQQFSKMLKGGGEKPFSDLMENTLRNWSHILSASMKNQAALTTIIDASGEGYVTPNLKEGFFWKDGAVHNEKTGKIVGNGDLVQVGKDAEGNREVKSYTTAGRETVKVNIDGYESHFHINDPFLFESLSAVTYLGPQSKVLDMMRGFKNLLRFGVTLSPAFKASNLIKDSIQAAGLSGLDNNFVKNVMDGWASSKPGSPVYIAALAGGGVFNYGTTLEGNRSEVIKKLLARGVNGENIIDTKEKAKYWLAKIWHNYEDIGNRSENINRIALYEKMRNEGYSHLEASYHARDLMDFSMQGSSGAIRYLSQIVPFLNARLQGLYKLGRDGVNPTVRVFYNAATGKEISQNDAQKAKSFMTVATAISLASMALYLAFKDDDDFKKREQWDRDFFWWFKIPGTDEVIRIPKPFEFGSIGTLAERSLEQIVDKDVEGKRFGESIGRMVFQTFSLDPTPQFFKPLIDVYANKDSFTNAPIETAGMERLSKQERMTNETSALAKGLGGVSKALGAVTGGAAEMSPVQIDYMIKSYMGWMGGTIATASQYAMMPFNDGVYADADWQKRMSLGFVQKLPSVQSTYVTDFYQNNQAISQAYADMRHYAEIGDSAKVQEILEEKGDKIRLAKMYDAASKNMANVRKQLNHIQDPNNTSLNGEQKREEVLRLKGLISDIAYRAESIRLSMRK